MVKIITKLYNQDEKVEILEMLSNAFDVNINLDSENNIYDIVDNIYDKDKLLFRLNYRLGIIKARIRMVNRLHIESKRPPFLRDTFSKLLRLRHLLDVLIEYVDVGKKLNNDDLFKVTLKLDCEGYEIIK